MLTVIHKLQTSEVTTVATQNAGQRSTCACALTCYKWFVADISAEAENDMVIHSSILLFSIPHSLPFPIPVLISGRGIGIAFGSRSYLRVHTSLSCTW